MLDDSVRQFVRAECDAVRVDLQSQVGSVREIATANMLRLVSVAGEDGRNGKLGTLTGDVDALHKGLRAIDAELRQIDKRIFRLGVALGVLSVVGPAGVERLLQVIGW